MEEYTNIKFNMNSNEDANTVADIIKEVASKREPESPNELKHFIADIEVKENVVIVEDSCSLFSNTFCEMIPQIMIDIARRSFGPITMNAWFYSCNCGYEAEISGQIFKNGKFKMSFNDHE